MPEFDVLVYGAQPFPEIGILDGKIAALHGGTAREEIDARGLHVFPGVIDSHVHFNEPGRTDWEGIQTGSRAVAAGGGTVFFDMPLNAHPPTVDAEAFDLKLAAAEKNSLTDFALWGGLVPGNLDQLAQLAERGVVGFKAFMANSGIEDFACVDPGTLRDGMRCAAQLRLPVAVHAESETLTRKLAAEKMAAGKVSIRDYLESRPPQAELDAIRCAIELAGETGCALHVVHVSTGEGVTLVGEARRNGMDISCETCPHYLMLSEADMEALGAVAKCAPPLRPVAVQQRLWECVAAGKVTTVASDHSPSPPAMKRNQDFFKVWGGISSAQHTLPLLLTGCLGRGAPLALVSTLLAANVAERFGLLNKGRIAVGNDADLALVDLHREFSVQAEDLFYRHRQSPYLGRTLRGRVRRTLLRGQTIFADDKVMANPCGHLIKPAR